MVNPLTDDQVRELSDWVERSLPQANAWGISCSDVASLCATALYWHRKYAHLEKVTTGELAAVS
jgi:hypothetical protein